MLRKKASESYCQDAQHRASPEDLSGALVESTNNADASSNADISSVNAGSNPVNGSTSNGSTSTDSADNPVPNSLADGSASNSGASDNGIIPAERFKKVFPVHESSINPTIENSLEVEPEPAKLEFFESSLSEDFPKKKSPLSIKESAFFKEVEAYTTSFKSLLFSRSPKVTTQEKNDSPYALKKEVSRVFLLGIFFGTLGIFFLPDHDLTFNVYIFLAFIVSASLCELFEIKIRRNGKIESVTFIDGLICAAALLLHPGAVIVATFFAATFSQLLLKRSFIKSVFNVGSYLISTTFLLLTYHLIAGAQAGTVLEGRLSFQALVALLFGSLVFCVINLVLLYRIFYIVDDSSIKDNLRTAFPLASMVVLGSASLGAITAIVAHSSPALLPVVVIVASILLLTYKTAAAVENHKDRSDQLTTFASFLALSEEDRVPSFLALLKRAFHADQVLLILNDEIPLTLEEEDLLLKEKPSSKRERSFLRIANFSKVHNDFLPEKWRSALLAPLKSDDKKIGVVAVGSFKKSFDNRDASLLISLLASFEVTEENDSLFKKIQAITSSQTESIIMIDEKGIISFTNPAADSFFGVPLLKRPAEEIFSLKLNQKEVSLTQEQRTVGENASLSLLPSMLLTSAQANKQEHQENAKLVDFALTPVTSLGGMLFVFSDISELRKAKMDLEVSQKELVRLGRTLQESLLPPVLPSSPHFLVAARYHAGAEGLDVGGDFYDLIEHKKDDWTVIVGDVCGRGAEAAALTSLMTHTLHAASLRETSPTVMLEILNESILRHSSDDRFSTVAVCKLSLEKEPALTVSLAGHPPVIAVSKDGTVKELGIEGTLIGVVKDIDVSEETYLLEEKDFFILYTDGVIETRNQEGVFFAEHFYETLSQVAGKSAQEVCAHLDNALNEFRGTQLADDDTAFLVISLN